MKRISYGERTPFTIAILAAFLLSVAGCQKQALRETGIETGITTKSPTNNNFRFMIHKWFQGDSVPVPRRGAIGFSIGSKGYIGGGETNVPPYAHTLTDFWEYDQASNTWTRKADLPFGVQEAATFVIGAQGYVCTGYNIPAGEPANYATSVNYLYQYDQASNTWTRKTDFPGGARVGAVGVNIGNLGYVGTGSAGAAGDFLNDWWQYNPLADQWTREANLPGAARMFASGFSVGASGFVTCGYAAGPTDLNDLWMYNAANNAWSRKADLPATAREKAVGFNYGQYGALSCGQHYAYPSPNVYPNDFWYYDPNADLWHQDPNMAGGGRGWAVGFSIAGTPYVGTGFNDNTSYMNDLWYEAWVPLFIR